jgi:hypothetical protein
VGGTAADCHQTRDAGNSAAELLSYVRRNWDSEMEIEEPANPDEVVQIYFEDVDEQYSIREI